MLNINELSSTDSHIRRFTPSNWAPIDYSGMSLRTHSLPDITIVEAYGSVDACNAARLCDFVDNLANPGRPLILDLFGVDSFGGDGFGALVRIAENCRSRGVRWALMPGEAVDRLLRITDSGYWLPGAASLEETLQQLTPANHAWSLPQRVTPPEVTRC